MNRKFLLLVGGVTLAVLLFTLGSTPKAYADQPFSLNFDIIMCDGTGGGNPAGCGTAIVGIGDNDGFIELGDNPEIKTNLTLDISPAQSDENIFGLANTVWKGITPAAGGAITDGDAVGKITFTIESSLISPATSNVSGVTGQPPLCASGVAQLGDTFEIYDAELATTPTVSTKDTDANGLAQEFDDLMLADGSAGSNGLMDGIDVMPDVLPGVIASVGLGSPTSRAFGKAIVSSELSVEATINFLVYDYDTDGDSTNDGYLSVTVLNYPGQPGQPPGPTTITAQTVVTCPPFVSNVRIYGKSVPGNTPVRTVAANGNYAYWIDASSGDNYDGDAAAADFDSCEQAVSVNSDLAPAFTDPDSDRWDSACDPRPATADNDGDTSVGPYITPPINTFPGAWEPDQDVDGDTTLNTVDNCPFTADADVVPSGGDTVVDYQVDSDSDTVGDVCDQNPPPVPAGTPTPVATPWPNLKGNGDGYATPAPGTYTDSDDRCIDYFSIPGVEPANASPNGFCVHAGLDGKTGTGDDGIAWPDSNDDGDPDWADVNNSGTYGIGEPIDTDDDTDGDTHTDACEAVKGSDALAPASVPAGPPAAGDCDGDTTTDLNEEKTHRDPFVPGEGVTPTATPEPPTPTATATPGGCIDRDGSSTCRDASTDTDDDGCSLTKEPLLGSNFSDSTWYDVFDVPVPANADPNPNGPRNRIVDIGDVLGVLFYAFAKDNQGPNGNGVDYDSQKGFVLPAHAALEVGQMYDRSPGAPAIGSGVDPAGAPNGNIDIADVLGALAQAFKVNCTTG